MLKQYIIAIGGSAGSLVPLTQIFEHTPLNNASYVILRHLPINYQSRLNLILQRHSTLRVSEATQGASIENNTIYYAPARYHLTIDDGILRLASRTNGNNREIDIFLQSLAANENRRQAIAVILSGTGYDGVKGAAAIRKAGGMVIAQSPQSCEFPQLPLAIIEKDLADFVLSPRDMPAVIHGYVNRHVYDNGNDLYEV